MLKLSSQPMIPASGAAAEARDNSFTYTFSPGRSPFSEKLGKHVFVRNDGYDTKRVTIVDDIPEEESKEGEPPASDNSIQSLRRELKGGENPPGYLHTESGLLSDAHGVAAIVMSLKELFIGRTSSVNSEGRITARLSALGSGIHITTKATLINFTYNQVNFIDENAYTHFIEPIKNGEMALVDNFLEAKLQSEFSYRYVPADSTARPNVYEWRRRLDSYVLGENIDGVEVLNLVDLAEAYSTKLEQYGSSPLESSLSMSDVSIGSMSPDSCAANSAAKNPAKSKKTLRESLGDRLSMAPPERRVPRFTDKKLGLRDLQVFANMPGLVDHLSQKVEIDRCSTIFSGIQNDGHVGRLNFESNTLILSPELMQYATQTVQNIRADLFLRRVRLAIMISCLNDQTLQLWHHNENKIGLCETLLNDLEHPLIASDQAENIALIKSMRDDPATLFDCNTLIGVANHLFEQAQTKAHDLIAYCKNLKTRSPAMVWNTTKKLLSEIDLVEQLSALAEHQQCQELAQFTRICGTHLEASFDNRALFERLLTQQGGSQAFPSVVKEIIALIKQIIKNTESPYRENFLKPITEEEMQASQGFDPFLMYTITKILKPREDLIKKIEKVEKLNAYYVLLEICGAWDAVLKARLENAINVLQQDQSIEAIEETIKEQVLNLPYKDLQVLYKELNLKTQYYYSKVIDNYREFLYLKINEVSQAGHDDGVEVQQYFDQRYHEAINLPHGFTSFDKATKSYIEKKAVTYGRNLEHYWAALFFRHFYVGLLFRDYLLCKPQEAFFRAFLFSDFASAGSPWAAASSEVELIKRALSKKIQQPLTGREAEIHGRITTSDVYIKELEKELLELKERLEKYCFNFISLCVWISALVNRDSFSPGEIERIEQKITQILGEYSNVSNEVFTDSLLNIMNQAWQTYLDCERISQAASDEWLAESDNCVKIQELFEIGQRLFASENSTATQKTIWLNAALQFCYTIKGSLQASDRRSSRLSTQMDRLIKEGSDTRRSVIFQILVMVLTNQNLSPWQRERLQQFKKELVKCNEIRDLALSNIVELMRDASGSKKHFIGSQVPDLIFYSDECEIFADPNFPKKANDELFSPGQSEALTIDKFIGNLLEALTYVVKLARNEQYRVFLPYIMEPLFTSFSVIYYYLTTAQARASITTMESWYKCIQEIKKIGEIVNTTLEESVAECTRESSDKYGRFATVWEGIRSRVVSHCFGMSFNSEINSQVYLYDFIDAYNVCVELKAAGFKVGSAIKEIASQWYKVTNYVVDSREMGALNMVLMEHSHETALRKADQKLARLSAFFMRHVKQVLRLGPVFFVLVSDDFPQRYSKHLSANGLDKIADDLQKIYTIRLEGWRIDNTYPAPFRYPVVLVYRRPVKWFGSGVTSEGAYNCIEIYEERGIIVRRDCSARGSSLISRASAVLPVANEARSLSLLEQVISDNHCFRDAISPHIFPKFFAILLDLLDDSMRVMKLHSPLSPPLSCALLRPADAVYNDPRALIHCSENQLIGLFFLGLIYRNLEQQEKKQERVAAEWFLNLPRFFGKADNVSILGENGIVNSGILKTKYGSSGRQKDPITTELKRLDENLTRRQRERGDTVQSSYCTWFKQTRCLFPNQGTSSASSSGNNSAASLSSLSSGSKGVHHDCNEYKPTKR
ncbi:MAG: hypothetical protein KBD83_00305 [Gammaproteobacteria bacterium]|nr:hypothetical protein [Gammaproteobacteria bacterium]